MEKYTQVAEFAQTWGLVYFVLIFAGVLAYTFRPKNRKRFEDAANIPFRED